MKVLNKLTIEEAIKELSRYTDQEFYTPQNRAAHQMAIEALERGRWIPVEERLPENEVDVLVLCERRLYGIRELDCRISKHVAMAFHTDGTTNTEDSEYTWELWDTAADYDEEADAYIIPEGWWERVLYGEEFSAVDDFVTHWMPLPEAPDHQSNREHTGCEWCEPGHEVCGTCVRFFDGYVDGCVTGATDEKCAAYVPADHCMKCGRNLRSPAGNDQKG